jgi:hypothetical protein
MKDNNLIWLVIGFIIGILLTTYIIFNSNKTNNNKFIQTLDSLNIVINNKQNIIEDQNFKIIILNKKDSLLSKQISLLNIQRTINKQNTISKINNTNFNNLDTLYNFFITRYNVQDSINLTLPKQTIKLAAKDLIMCDNDRIDIQICDSTNSILNDRINIKDSIIYAYQIKDTSYKDIISSQEIKNNNLVNENSKLNKQNKTLKFLSKVLTTGIIIILLL